MFFPAIFVAVDRPEPPEPERSISRELSSDSVETGLENVYTVLCNIVIQF